MNKSTANKMGKVISYRRFYEARYPNGATARYYGKKLLDIALAAAISMGSVTTFLFMLAVL